MHKYILVFIKNLKKKKTGGAGAGGAMPSIAPSMNKLLLILI